jgi:hypothetical protein
MDGTDCNRSGVFPCAIWPVEEIRCPVKIHVRAKTPGHCWSGETGRIVGIAVGGFEVSDFHGKVEMSEATASVIASLVTHLGAASEFTEELRLEAQDATVQCISSPEGTVMVG